MKYTRENYEEFALDYLEGSLTPEESEMFETFLLLHPDIKAEIEEFKWVTVKPNPELQFPDHTRLLKNPGGSLVSMRYSKWMGIAAAIMLLLVSGVLLWKTALPTGETSVVVNEPVEQPESEAMENPATEIETDDLTVDAKETIAASEPDARVSPRTNDLAQKEPETPNHRRPDVNLLQNEMSEVLVQNEVPKYHDSVTDLISTQAISREAVSVPMLDDQAISYLVYERPIHEKYLPEIYLNDQEEKGSVARFFAKTNFIPSVLADLDKEELKEKFIPESFQSR